MVQIITDSNQCNKAYLSPKLPIAICHQQIEANNTTWSKKSFKYNIQILWNHIEWNCPEIVVCRWMHSIYTRFRTALLLWSNSSISLLVGITPREVGFFVRTLNTGCDSEKKKSLFFSVLYETFANIHFEITVIVFFMHLNIFSADGHEFRTNKYSIFSSKPPFLLHLLFLWAQKAFSVWFMNKRWYKSHCL